MKPTIVGGSSAAALATPSVTVSPSPAPNVAVMSVSPAALVAPFTGSKIILLEEQVPVAEQLLGRLDFASIPAKEVISLGFEAEQGLNRTLDGFMSRLDKNSAAQVFALFDRLQKGVKEADLEGVLKDIENAHPGFWDRLVGKFHQKSVPQIAQETFEKVRAILAGKTTTLREKMVELEKELNVQIQKLTAELQSLGQLKLDYGNHLKDFALQAGVTEAFAKKAEVYVGQRKAELANDTSPQARSEIEELEFKLQFLQSRALALEGTYTRLPADQEVIRQIEVAGVSTLGEVLTTASSRFASIKMTLISANSALTVKGVQNLSQASAALDASLLAARGRLVKEAAVTAASAPGENRLAQAAQIQDIVTQTAELYQLVDTARKQNVQKFASAKRTFETAREALANLAEQNFATVASVN